MSTHLDFPARVVAAPIFPLALAVALFGSAFCLATTIQPRHASIENRRASGDLLSGFLGEGRKLFADHFYTKADVYFHSGYYPTIFDSRQSHQTAHIAEDAGVTASKNTGDEDTFLGPPSDWIDAHGRMHFPARHTHLGEDAPGELTGGSEREILPWLKLASTLDPNKVESYTVAAYWLRRIGNHAEAEKFLRDGLNANLESVEILFELGRCRFDAQDSTRARNIWEMAWRSWQAQESTKPVEEQNRFLATQILVHLARLESRQGSRDRCLFWLESLVPLKANAEEIRQRIVEVKAGLPFEAESRQEEASPKPQSP